MPRTPLILNPNNQLSPYREHCQKWSNGCGNEICKQATKICYYRGDITCDVLLIGQSPGKSEDVHGIPFCGPAGHKLDYIVGRALSKDVKVGFTNLVGCMARDEDGDESDPDVDEIKMCRSRLEEIVRIANPRLIVTVGNMSTKWTEQGYKHSPKLPNVLMVSIVHPSHILQQPLAAQPLLIKRAIVTINNAWERVSKGGK